MPTFESNSETKSTVPPSTKMLYLGHSRSGKTGSLVSLAAAGYDVRILDLDQKSDVCRDFVLNREKSIYRRAREGLWTQAQADTVAQRLSFVSLAETTIDIRGTVVPKGDLWTKINAQFTKWTDAGRDLGSIDDWGPEVVLVIDGLSRLAQAAFTNVLALNGRLTSRPEQGDYNIGQQMVLRLMPLLAAKRCNVIVVCHIQFVEVDGQPMKGFPQTVGKAINHQIPQHFSHALMAKVSGQGDKERRVIVTQSSGMIDLGSAAPLRVKAEYDLATGLAEYFRDIRQ